MTLSESLDDTDRSILARAWTCVGRVSDVEQPGAWVRARVAGEDILVMRGEDLELRAFYNICRHRGTPLLDGDSGRSARIECPYHGWTYACTGALVVVPGVAEFDRRGFGLRTVRVATWRGFVFVTLESKTPALEGWMGDVPPWLDAVKLAFLKRARRVSYDIAAGWRLVVANFQESHHFPRVHPELEHLTPTTSARSFLRDGSMWLGGEMDIENAETVSLSGRLLGRPLIVSPERAHVVYDALLFPTLLTSLQPDYFLTYRLEPTLAQKTRITAEIFVHPSLKADADLADVFDFWDRVNAQDRAICERQQLGVNSRGFEPGPSTAADEGVRAFERLLQGEVQGGTGAQRSEGGLVGIWGEPYIDLSSFIDTSSFGELDREITRALCRVAPAYTGGTLKWMGVVAPWVVEDGYADAMHVLESLEPRDLAEFISLGDDPGLPLSAPTEKRAFGDETDHPFNYAQMRWLSFRHGVYFPWKVCFHLLENDRWEDKHSGDGKTFSTEAENHMPKTLAFVKSLPFREIGRAVLFGVEPNDHAPAHRDTEPGAALHPAQSISFDPRGDKGLYLMDASGQHKTHITAPVYWFNDADYHGVDPAKRFRYSIRVDGVFHSDFLAKVHAKFNV